MIKTTYEKMKFLFESGLSVAEKHRNKQLLFDQLRENYELDKKEFKVLSYDNWFAKNLNNTHLLGVQRYQIRVEQFANLFEQQGRKWSQFFESVRELAKVSDKERNQQLKLQN